MNAREQLHEIITRYRCGNPTGAAPSDLAIPIELYNQVWDECRKMPYAPKMNKKPDPWFRFMGVEVRPE